MVFSPPRESFSSFAEAFDGRIRTPSRRPGWFSLRSLGGHQHYDPNQPRVPAGHHDGGQWTLVGSDEPPGQEDKARRLSGQQPIRLAARETPRIPNRLGAALTLALEALAALIRFFRQENAPSDLFGERKDRKDDTVASTIVDDTPVIGVNSTHHTYTAFDRIAAKRLRQVLLRKYPDEMATENIGLMPNDALFHAETTILLRAAKASGGTLAGKTLEVMVDRQMCYSCEKMLPYIGLEVGNPIVTFTELDSMKRRTMRDGNWIVKGPKK